MSVAKNAPWLLWGGSQQIELVMGSSAGFELNTQQLAKISYKRPESWKWLFTLEVIEVETSDVTRTGVVQVRYNLTTGIGRTSITLKDFELFIYTPTLPLPGQHMWSTSVLTPPRDSSMVAPFPQNYVSEIVAQDLQLNVNALLTGRAAVGTRVVLRVSAFFSPISHVRPEWFKEEFPGNEDGS